MPNNLNGQALSCGSYYGRHANGTTSLRLSRFGYNDGESLSVRRLSSNARQSSAVMALDFTSTDRGVSPEARSVKRRASVQTVNSRPQTRQKCAPRCELCFWMRIGDIETLKCLVLDNAAKDKGLTRFLGFAI